MVDTKALAKKLVTTDISNYIAGEKSKAFVKKFTSKEPTLKTDNPNATEEENADTFNAANVKKDTNTRRADYQPGEDVAAYEERQLSDTILEKVVRKMNAQKEGALNGHKASSHETPEKDGLETTEPMKKITESFKKVVLEGGNPFESANDPNKDAPNTDPDMENDEDDEDDDDDEDDNKDKKPIVGNDKTAEAKQYLETIAKSAATSFEGLPDDLRLPTWVLDKLRLAHDFLDSIEQHILDNSEFADNEEDDKGNDIKDEDDEDEDDDDDFGSDTKEQNDDPNKEDDSKKKKPSNFKESVDLDEGVKSGNPGYGYHGQFGSDVADKEYSKGHRFVKNIARKAGHLKDVKYPNIMVKHYLDSKHGRHLVDFMHDKDIVAKDFHHFKKTYKPEHFDESRNAVISKLVEKTVFKATLEEGKRADPVDDSPPGLRKIGTYENGPHKATIHKDSEWNEYRVKTYHNGKYTGSYHTDDKQDAHDTAKHHVATAHERV